METGLFEIQAAYLREFRQRRQGKPLSREIAYALFGRADPVSFDPTSHGITDETVVPSSGSSSVEPAVDRTADLARCFLRFANLPNFALDRLSRYEATLWRQAGQILFALDALDRRKPQERGAVSLSVAGETCRPMEATTIELPEPLTDSIDVELGS
jgi:hypothetical protein